MAILWAGGEDIDFLSTVQITTNGAFYRAGYARCGVGTQNGEIRGYIFPGGAVTNCWLRCRVVPANGGSMDPGNRYFGLGKSGTANELIITGANASGTKIGLATWNGATLTQLAAETGNSIGNANTMYDITMQVINFGATATVNVWFAGTQVISFTGNATVGGITALDQFVITHQNNGATYCSEIIVADENLLAFGGLVTMSPTAAGTTDQWTGLFTDVNELANNDATFVFTNTAGQDEQFNLTDMPGGTFAVKAVVVNARATSTVGSAATQVSLGFNSGGTVAVGAPIPTTAAWASAVQIFANNPVTSAAWNPASMNALQVNLRAIT